MSVVEPIDDLQCTMGRFRRGGSFGGRPSATVGFAVGPGVSLRIYEHIRVFRRN